MIMSEIQDKINYYSGCYDDCNRRIDEVNQKIEKVSALSTNLEDYIRKVGEDFELRREKLNNFGSTAVRSSIIGKYFSGMNELLTGSEYQQKYYELDQGLQRVNQTISELDEQLLQLSGERDDAWSNKTYWEEQMPFADDYSA